MIFSTIPKDIRIVQSAKDKIGNNINQTAKKQDASICFMIMMCYNNSYPCMEPELVENFWEFRVGEVESHPASDFMDAPTYQKWLAQAPDFGFPGGETLMETQLRALAGMDFLEFFPSGAPGSGQRALLIFNPMKNRRWSRGRT